MPQKPQPFPSAAGVWSDYMTAAKAAGAGGQSPIPPVWIPPEVTLRCTYQEAVIDVSCSKAFNSIVGGRTHARTRAIRSLARSHLRTICFLAGTAAAAVGVVVS